MDFYLVVYCLAALYLPDQCKLLARPKPYKEDKFGVVICNSFF